MTATTALTAQNTLGVYDIHHTPPGFLQKQIDACMEDIGVDVIKTGASPLTSFDSFQLTFLTGMLASVDAIRVVADSFRKHNVGVSVVDPVQSHSHTMTQKTEHRANDEGHGIYEWFTVVT